MRNRQAWQHIHYTVAWWQWMRFSAFSWSTYVSVRPAIGLRWSPAPRSRRPTWRRQNTRTPGADRQSMTNHFTRATSERASSPCCRRRPADASRRGTGCRVSRRGVDWTIDDLCTQLQSRPAPGKPPRLAIDFSSAPLASALADPTGVVCKSAW